MNTVDNQKNKNVLFFIYFLDFRLKLFVLTLNFEG